MPKAATIKFEDNGSGHGRTIVNGIDISSVVCGFQLYMKPGERTIAIIEIVLEGVGVVMADVETVLKDLTPTPEILRHIIQKPKVLGPEICIICRQVVGNPKWNPDECPGEPDWWKRMRLGAKLE